MRKHNLLWVLLGSAWLARSSSAQGLESPPAEAGALRTQVVWAIPWGDQAGQVGRQNFPEAAHDFLPADFCRAPNGALWVCDGVNNRLVSFPPLSGTAEPAGQTLQIPLDQPTHVAVSEQGVFIVDWPRRVPPDDLLQCRLWHYAGGRMQEKAAFQDAAAGYLPGQLIALKGGDLLVVGDRLHRVKPDGEVQEVPIKAPGLTVVVSPVGGVYQVEQWEREAGVLRGRVKCWSLDAEEQEPSWIEVALPYDTGPDMDPEWLESHPSGARLIGADGAGRLYFILYERLRGGLPRLTLARFSSAGELLARGYFQPDGVDLRQAWNRCLWEFWRVTPEGQVLVALPTEQEYRIIEAAFEPAP